MGNVCLILGKSGSGKSTSIKGLDPKETVIFNVLKKRLPFKGSASVYNTDNKNLFNLDEYDKINSINNNQSYLIRIILNISIKYLSFSYST